MPQGNSGRARSSNGANQDSLTRFIIQALLLRVRTTLPVQVISCTNAGGLSPVGTVTVQPLVGQVDGDGNVIAHGKVYNVPYLRMQGGANGVILDPAPGDIGIAVFCDRDISAVKKSKGAAPPGSRRKHDMSDAVYLSTIIGAAPTQYVQFSPAGITVHSPVKVKVEAPVVEVDASTSATITTPTLNIAATTINSSGDWHHDGNITTPNDVIANGTHLHTHTHSSVRAGTDTSGPPV